MVSLGCVIISKNPTFPKRILAAAKVLLKISLSINVYADIREKEKSSFCSLAGLLSLTPPTLPLRDINHSKKTNVSSKSG